MFSGETVPWESILGKRKKNVRLYNNGQPPSYSSKGKTKNKRWEFHRVRVKMGGIKKGEIFDTHAIGPAAREQQHERCSCFSVFVCFFLHENLDEKRQKMIKNPLA